MLSQTVEKVYKHIDSNVILETYSKVLFMTVKQPSLTFLATLSIAISPNSY